MRVSDLTAEYVNRRLKVTGVKVGDAERAGYINDTERLLGQTGTLTEVRMYDGACAQAWVDWDDESPGSLMLAQEDQVELL